MKCKEHGWTGTPCPACRLLGQADREVYPYRTQREREFAKHDWLGNWDDDPAPGVRGNPDCECAYCRFYRREGGIRYVMCARDWEALPNEVKAQINESVND